MSDRFRASAVHHIGFPLEKSHSAITHFIEGEGFSVYKRVCCTRDDRRPMPRYGTVICEYQNIYGGEFSIGLTSWHFGVSAMRKVQEITRRHGRMEGMEPPDMVIKRTNDPFHPLEITLDTTNRGGHPRWRANKAVGLAAEKLFESMPLWKGYEKPVTETVIRISRIQLLMAVED